MTTHVFIATTQGPVAVQSVRQLDDSLMSSVCINGQAKEASISRPYYHFAKPGIGLVAEDFGKHVWRIDLSDNIDEGSSWQLGVYLAHHFHQLGQLGNGNATNGDTVVWATGEVSIDREVRRVEAIPKKMASSQGLFDAQRALGNEVTVMAPTQSVAALAPAHWNEYAREDTPTLQLVNVASVDEAILALAETTQAPAEPKVPVANRRLPGVLATLAVVALAAGYAAKHYSAPEPDGTPSPITAEPAPRTTAPDSSQDSPSPITAEPDRPKTDVTLTAYFAEPQYPCPDPETPLQPNQDVTTKPVTLLDHSRFAATDLERLCWQILEEGSGAKSVVAVSLRRPGAVRAESIAPSRWLIPAMSFRLAQREQALLLFSDELSDSHFDRLSKALSELGPGQLSKPDRLEQLLSQQSLHPTVFRQTLQAQK